MKKLKFIKNSILCFTVVMLIMLFAFNIKSFNSVYAEEVAKECYIVEWSTEDIPADKIGMIHGTYYSKMQLEKVDGGYILYTRIINRNQINSYKTSIKDSKHKLNQSLLAQDGDSDIYATYILDSDIKKKISVSFYVVPMGQNKEIKVLINFDGKTIGIDKKYSKAVSLEQNNKPINYFYSYYINDIDISNINSNLKINDLKDYKITKIEKVFANGTIQEVDINNMRYKIEMSGENLECENANYIEKINYLKLENTKTLYIEYYVNGDNSNTTLKKSLTFNKVKEETEKIENEDTEPIFNKDNKSKDNNGVIIGSVTGSIVGAILIGVIVFIIIKKRKFKG